MTMNHYRKIIEKTTEKLQKTTFTNPHSARVAEVVEAMTVQALREGKINVMDFGILNNKYSRIKKQLAENPVEFAGVAGYAHDVGKRIITEKHGHTVWEKKSSLTPREWKLVEEHPVESHNFVMKIPGKYSEAIADVILHHHERYDGKGYPKKLSGKQIPAMSRMLAVADALDSIIYSRPYRKSRTLGQAVKELEKNKGTQFDPQIVDLLKRMIKNKDKALSTYVPLNKITTPLNHAKFLKKQ
jgi:HD-GYP domain-containing protein (c-di-GMP phosphodiesterase class II)